MNTNKKENEKMVNGQMVNEFDVIDQFFAAQVACNESEATLKALRPQVEAAIQELIKEQGKPT